jgi:hypothetical protein
MSDQPVARPVPTRDNTTQEDEEQHPCRKRDPSPRPQRPSDQGFRLRPGGRWDRHNVNFVVT